MNFETQPSKWSNGKKWENGKWNGKYLTDLSTFYNDRSAWGSWGHKKIAWIFLGSDYLYIFIKSTLWHLNLINTNH